MEEIEAKIKSLAEKHRDLIESNPRKAASILMGELMKTYRGRVDGAKLYQMVIQAIRGQA